jgi:methylmalonyl-CoA mutase cobalamin-binding subunit
MSGFGEQAALLLDLAGGARLHPAIDLGLGLLADGATLEQIVLDVLAPVQRQVGVLWETNRWGVADEHAATAVVDGVLGAVSLETPVHEPLRGDVLVACAEGEHHTLPARMGVEILRAQGWQVTFLGGSLPADDMQRFAARSEPDAVVVSCTLPLSLPGARRGLAAVGELGLPALAAGAAFGPDASRARRLGARGWLGPGIDLATVLEDPSAPAEPTRRPAAPEALALELDRDALQATCLEVMVDRMPVMATYSAAQLRSTRTDVGYILAFLSTAVDVDDDDIFHCFVSWLSGVLTHRGVPPAVLDRSLVIIGEVLREAGSARAATLCGAVPGTADR